MGVAEEEGEEAAILILGPQFPVFWAWIWGHPQLAAVWPSEAWPSPCLGAEMSTGLSQEAVLGPDSSTVRRWGGA